MPEIVARLERILGDLSWEVIFVDDASPDGTAEAVRALARVDRRVRLVLRHNRRGLSSDTRLKISNTGIRLANAAFGLSLTDPLTGFFAIRRTTLLRALPGLSGLGFKILLDIITAARPTVVELPFRFRTRMHGESKLDNRVMYDFFLFFLEKKVARFLPLPARFLSFAMINSVGILVHLAVFWSLVALAGAGFAAGQLVATLVAMGFNYTVNNAVTYNDMRLRGPAFWRGFALFAALCSLGVLGNVGVASMLHAQYADLAWALPALAGAVITVVWNYAATRAFVWGRGWVCRPLERRAAG